MNMREHKFRGKRTDNGEWVYGYYCRRYANIKGVSILQHCIQVVDEALVSITVYEVDPATVGMCTVLPDKNGKEIFDGDILSARVLFRVNKRPSTCFITGRHEISYSTEERREPWSVEYKVFNARMGWFAYGRDRRFHTTLSRSMIANVDAVIIGNIHDNPELMEVQHER
jgi:uncharacterized phage protein (TIGR01671 family)